jgi:hypothetical protein
MPDLTYSEEDAAQAPHGTVRFPGTDAEVVAYRINDRDLCLLVNKGGQCVYRATIANALDPDLKPHLNPLIDDSFVVRDLAAARRLADELLGKQ